MLSIKACNSTWCELDAGTFSGSALPHPGNVNAQYVLKIIFKLSMVIPHSRTKSDMQT
jgi:hypothetical protein